MVWFEYIRIQ